MDGAGQFEVFVGMAPRDREEGTAEAVSRAFLVSADCDDDASLDALLAFPVAPSIIVASGSRTETDRAKIHAHWFTGQIDAATLVNAKKALIGVLGSDKKISSAAGILRVPGCSNHKTGDAAPVEVIGGNWEPVNVADLFEACDAATPKKTSAELAAEALNAGARFELPT